MFEGGRTPLIPAAELAELGYRLVIVPSDLQRAAIHGMQLAAATLRRDGSSAAIADRLASFEERDEIIGLAQWSELEKRYGD
jgi:2-methylisocitrate lyase-like PEP mutase family enzyme